MSNLKNPYHVERIGGIPTLLQEQNGTHYQRAQYRTMKEAKEAAKDAWDAWQLAYSSEYN